MDDLKQSLKKVFEERIASPLFGYVTLAWIGINWKPLVLLFMGNEPPSERITIIDLLPDYMWQFWTPLWLGALIACLTPYLHLLLQQVHYLATLLKDLSTAKEVERRYLTEKKLAKYKVQTVHAEGLETARQKTREAILDARRNRIEANTQKLKSDVNELLNESEKLKAENRQILAARTQLEIELKGLIDGLLPLAKAETADELMLIRGNALISLENIKSMTWPKPHPFLKFASDDSIHAVKAAADKVYLEYDRN